MIILLAIGVIWIVAIVWIWYSLGEIEKNKKIAFIIIGSIILFIITFIIFQISKSGIIYEKEETKKDIQNMLVLTFTVVNSLIVLPYIATQLNKVKKKEIKKEKFNRRISIIMFVFIICLILECGYMRDTQQGILKIYNAYCNIG